MLNKNYNVARLFYEGEITVARVKEISSLLDQLHPGRKTIKPVTLPSLILYAHTHRLIVARYRTKIIGMATLALFQGFSQVYGEVKEVVVDQKHRGRGVARALMEEVMSTAKRSEVSILVLMSGDQRKEAHRLYESLGFEKRSKTNKFALRL